jgi:hypothetical protein
MCFFREAAEGEAEELREYEMIRVFQNMNIYSLKTMSCWDRVMVMNWGLGSG